MHPSLDVSPTVAALLSPQGLAELDRVDPAGALDCAICGQVKPAGDATPMAVVVGERAGVLVVGFAHRPCRDEAGDVVPGLVDQLEDSGVDATAFFGVRATPILRAVMIFEPAASGAAWSDTGQELDPYAFGHLQLGFVPARVPIPDLSAPPAAGWSLRARGGQLILAHKDAGIGYMQELNPDLRAWLKVVRREGRALVVTGTRLGLRQWSGLPDLSAAMAQGRVVAATVLLS